MKTRRGTNQYSVKHKKYTKEWLAILGIAVVVCYTGRLASQDILGRIKTAWAQETAIISPLPETERVLVPVPYYFEEQNIDQYVGDAVDEFYKSPGDRSHMRSVMHCLLYKETKHNYSKGHGDGGKAGGPLQFHQPTWDGYRKIMIKEGYATEVGSRYDLKEAIRTTVWAFQDGRGKAWGPYLRKECQ